MYFRDISRNFMKINCQFLTKIYESSPFDSTRRLPLLHRFTSKKGVYLFRYFLSLMCTPILLLCAHDNKRIGVRIRDRKYLNRYTPFPDVNLCLCLILRHPLYSLILYLWSPPPTDLPVTHLPLIATQMLRARAIIRTIAKVFILLVQLKQNDSMLGTFKDHDH